MKRIGLLAFVTCLVMTGCQEGVEVKGAPVAEPAPVAAKDAANETAAKTPTKEEVAKAQEMAKKGTVAMNDESKPPRERYKIALEIYREALALDPENKEAKENKALIEGIYKSMGKPVPGE